MSIRLFAHMILLRTSLPGLYLKINIPIVHGKLESRQNMSGMLSSLE